MSVTLHAQPYDLSATGFYFETAEEFQAEFKANKNDYGEPVEEYEFQFIDGEDLDSALFKALGVHQGDVKHFLEDAVGWEEWEKINIIIAVGECGYGFNRETDDPSDFDVQIYDVDSLKELAVYFINEGLFGEIPDHLANYLDIGAMARNLAHDYTETIIAGRPVVYRMD